MYVWWQGVRGQETEPGVQVAKSRVQMLAEIQLCRQEECGQGSREPLKKRRL